MPHNVSDATIRPLIPALEKILEEHPDEADAAPKLRALAIKHGARRYRVFAAYRLLKQQATQETPK